MNRRWAASPKTFYWFCLAVAAVVVAAIRVIVFSPFGFGLRAVRDAAARAEALGFSRSRLQWAAFTLAGGFAAVAGGLFAFLKGSVFPDSLGVGTSVDGLVMVLLGGVGTVSGSVAGAALYKGLSIWLVSQTDYSKLVLGLFIVALCVALPRGLGGLAPIAKRLRRKTGNATPAMVRLEGAE